MRLAALRVLHLSKKQTLSPGFRFPEGARVFFLETCQRYIWVFNGENEIQPEFGQIPGNFFRGREAYLFLLRVATGLESEVIGETDVFGQLKEAWKRAEQAHRAMSLEIGPWIQKVFEDTKEIRGRYLQKLGGSSYGTLVRRLMKNQEGASGPILIVGAGKIAQSVAPFLLDSELWLWNRNPSNLCSFYQELSLRPHTELKKVDSRSMTEEDAWKMAAQVVVCIPFDAEADQKRIEWFQEGGSSRPVIHLGGLKSQSNSWSHLSNFKCLDDLFALQNSLGNIRTVQVAQAEKACEERSQLRMLGVSLSIPHGWEDLACFA